MIGIGVIPENSSIRILVGDKALIMKQAEIDKFISERGLRRAKLPKGHQEVKGVERAE